MRCSIRLTGCKRAGRIEQRQIGLAVEIDQLCDRKHPYKNANQHKDSHDTCDKWVNFLLFELGCFAIWNHGNPHSHSSPSFGDT